MFIVVSIHRKKQTVPMCRSSLLNDCTMQNVRTDCDTLTEMDWNARAALWCVRLRRASEWVCGIRVTRWIRNIGRLGKPTARSMLIALFSTQGITESACCAQACFHTSHRNANCSTNMPNGLKAPTSFSVWWASLCCGYHIIARLYRNGHTISPHA